MKVFISHSSQDKWAARRISEDLILLGSETFLDEKDIFTGESIDNKIQEHLLESDDFLILISPASIKSQWVLIELGGALALKKNIIPIFLYVGINEIPKPISKLLGRDINEIQKYYDEIKRVSSNNTNKNIQPIELKEVDSKFKIGDKVRLPLSLRDETITPGWIDEMNEYIGTVTKINSLFYVDNVSCAEVENNKFAWATNWLIKIE